MDFLREEGVRRIFPLLFCVVFRILEVDDVVKELRCGGAVHCYRCSKRL